MNPLEKLPSKVKGLTSTRIVITLAIIFAIFIETGVIFIVSCFAAANVLDMYFSDLSLAGLFVASYGFVMLFLNIGIRQRKKNIPAHNGRI